MSKKVVSFDGDAQRLVYFSRVKNKAPLVIDGDKQFCLIMHYIKLQLDNMQLVQYPICLVISDWANPGTKAFLNVRRI